MITVILLCTKFWECLTLTKRWHKFSTPCPASVFYLPANPPIHQKPRELLQDGWRVSQLAHREFNHSSSTCRQTAVKQRIPLRPSQTVQRSDNEPCLTSVHITAAISPVIIKLHGADRQIHINERSSVLDLAQLNVRALTLATVPTSRKWCSTWTLIIWHVLKT